jgi:tetratricopeptide (TPR) repeat protein
MHSAELAHHFMQATEFSHAVHYAVRAARWAHDRLAYEDVPAHYQAALDALELDSGSDPIRRAEILVSMGEAQMRLGDRERARLTLHQSIVLARSTTRPELFARATLGLAPAFFALEMAVTDYSLIALIEEALRMLGRDDSALRAQLLARLALALNWADAAERIARLDTEALESANRTGDPATMAYVMGARHAVLWGPANAEERLNTAARAVSTSLQAGDPEMALVYRLFEITDLIEVGRMAEASRSMHAFAELSEQLGLPAARWYRTLHRTLLSHMQGRLDETDRLAHEFLHLGQQVGDRNSILSFTCHLAMLRAEQGRVAEVEEPMHQMIREFPALELAWRSGGAQVFGENRMREQALRAFARASLNEFDDVPRNAMWLITLVFAACGAALLCDERRAAKLYTLLEPYADRIAIIGYSVACLGSVHRPLAVLSASLGEWDRAESHFELALRRNREIDSPLWVTHTLHYFSRALASRGGGSNRRRAQQLCNDALRLASHLDLINIQTNLRLLQESLSTSEPIRFSPLDSL